MKTPRPPIPVDASHVRDGGRVLFYAAGCNYLGLLHEPRLLAAMADALCRGPLHPGASRATTGEHALYPRAERALARFLRAESALLLPCGYMASLAALQALARVATHVVVHPDAHVCLRDGARASGLDPVAGWDGTPGGWGRLASRLPARARVVMALDGVAPAVGHVADLPPLLEALPGDGWLLVDDAHGVGTLGRRGGGSLEHHGIRDPRVVVTGSLSKAPGLFGGFVAGTARVTREARATPAFVGTTSPPLALAAGVLAVLPLLRDEPGRIRALQERAAWLHERLRNLPGVRSHPASPVVAFEPASREAARRAGRALRAAGIYPPFIRYPSGPGEGFLRFAACSLHAWDDLGRLVETVSRLARGEAAGRAPGARPGQPGPARRAPRHRPSKRGSRTTP